MIKYTHLLLNKDVPTPSGYYSLQKEVLLDYKGRQILYTVSDAVIESSCCGVADYCSVQVPGYILGWRVEQNKDGLPVSLVEPITDEATREDICQAIKTSERVVLAEFW
jgi:hypothetical protein